MKPKKLLYTAPLALLLIAPPSASRAGVDITTRNADSTGQTSAGRIRAQGKKLRIDLPAAQSGQPASSILFDADADVMRILRHDDKSYVEMDQKSAVQLGERFATARRKMEEQFAQMPPEQRAMMQKMLKQQGLPALGSGKAKPPPPPSIKSTGKSATVHGTPCTIYEIQRSGRVAGESCIAKWRDIDVSASDIAVMEDFATFQTSLSQQMGSFFGADQHPFATIDLERGLPVRARSIKEGKTTWESSFESIKPAEPAAEVFAVPSGYTRRELGQP